VLRRAGRGKRGDGLRDLKIECGKGQGPVLGRRRRQRYVVSLLPVPVWHRASRRVVCSLVFCTCRVSNSTPWRQLIGMLCPGAPRGYDTYSTASAVLHAVGGKLEHAAEGAVDATHCAASAVRHAASSADEAGKRALGLTSTPEEQEVFNAHNVVLAYDLSHTHTCMHKAYFTGTHACTMHVSHLHLNKSSAHVHAQPKSYTLSLRHTHTDPQTRGARTHTHTHNNTHRHN